MLIEEIKKDKFKAMKLGNKELSGALTLILSEIKQFEVDNRKSANDENVIDILKRMVKKANQSIEQFNKGNRSDLADIESSQIKVFEKYLPAQLSLDEVVPFVESVIKEQGASTIKEMGKVMGVLKKELHGKADMGMISKLVKEKLS